MSEGDRKLSLDVERNTEFISLSLSVEIIDPSKFNHFVFLFEKHDESFTPIHWIENEGGEERNMIYCVLIR